MAQLSAPDLQLDEPQVLTTRAYVSPRGLGVGGSDPGGLSLLSIALTTQPHLDDPRNTNGYLLIS